VRSNETIDVKITGRPGDLAWIVFSAQPTVQAIAPVVGPLLVGAPVLVPLGVLPTGELSFQTITFVPPGFEALVYYAQPLFADALGATLGEPAPIVEVSSVF
jgi:fumarate reductase subunit D